MFSSSITTVFLPAGQGLSTQSDRVRMKIESLVFDFDGTLAELRLDFAEMKLRLNTLAESYLPQLRRHLSFPSWNGLPGWKRAFENHLETWPTGSGSRL